MGHKPLKISPTEHRKQSASRVEMGRDEKMTSKISQMMDHSIETHRTKYTFVNTAKEAISTYKTLQEWRQEQPKTDLVVHANEPRQRKRKWTIEETKEVERVIMTRRIKFERLQQVREEFKDNDILKERTFKNILDKLRQLQK